MGARATWSNAMVEHLADGRWYTLDEVLAVGARLVPPGRAMQKRERNTLSQRRQSRARGAEAGYRRSCSADEAIKVGARQVAYDSLRMLTRSGVLERDGQLVRRAP